MNKNSMMILDDYDAEDQVCKESGGGNTPMLKRSLSTTHARHLPPIREKSRSISRKKDTDVTMSSAQK